MSIGIVFIGAATLVLSASSARAQGRPPQRVVLSEAVMKSMVANKPKSKTPLTGRLGMVRKPSGVTTKPAKAVPTSVGEIIPTSNRK